MNARNLIVFAVAALLLGTLTSVALAAPTGKKPLTGIWSGKTHQDLAPLGEDDDFTEWTQHIVVKAYKGRLVSVGTNVRYTCPDPTNPMAGDILLSLDWKLGLGPRLTPTGGFKLLVMQARNILTGKMYRLPIPVQINGSLGTGGGSGRFSLSKGNCSGKGVWQTRRSSKI